MKVKINDKEIYYDGWLHNEFSLIRDQIIKKDWDWVTFIDGIEGCGKSTLAQQLALLCDSTFNIDNICFTAKEFIARVKAANKYQAIVFDEAYGAIASTQTVNAICKTIADLLSQIRQKNLFVFIVAPTFFDITRNIAIWRSKSLIHVYLGQNYQRGFWRAYTTSKKKNLYILGKKLYNYNAVSPSARGRFTKQYTVDEEAYRKKKLDAFESIDNTTEASPKPVQQRNTLIKFLHNKLEYDTRFITNLLDSADTPLGIRQIQNIVK